eukprot:Hpha_TRINITY_DN16655_c0_g6::TRINITY_DN16655_c0_g6_i1::g.179860::m.179860
MRKERRRKEIRAPCGGQCQLSVNPVTVVGGSLATASFVINANAGGAVSFVCTPFDTALITVVAITPSGALQIVSAPGLLGTTDVTCIATGATGGTSSFTFRVIVAAGTPVPGGGGGGGSQVRWLRAIVRGSRRNFQRSLFEQAVRDALADRQRVLGAVVWFVCPAVACPQGNCPISNQGRVSAGCLKGEDYASGRRSEAMQQTDSALDAVQDLYVDFDVHEVGPSRVCEMGMDSCESYAQQLQTSLQACHDGNQCAFTPLAPTTPVSGQPILLVTPTSDFTQLTPLTSPPVLTAFPTQARTDDDDLSSGALVAIIVGCAVCYLIIVALLIWWWCRGRDKEEKREIHHLNGPPTEPSYPPPPQEPQVEPLVPPPEMKRSVSFADSEPVVVPPPVEATPSSSSVGRREASRTGTSRGTSYYDYYDYSTAGTESRPSEAATGEWDPREGDQVQAQYIDGEWYEAKVLRQDANGTFHLRWFDGSISDGVPIEQMTPS